MPVILKTRRMKQLFKDVTAALDETGLFRWVDKDKGQMNFENPPILFPAALVTISVPQRQNINRLKQACRAQIRIKLCYDWGGNTSGVTPQAQRDASLKYYDDIDAVWEKFQGWSTANINPLECQGNFPLARPDQYTTEEIVFVGDFYEEKAA